MTHDALIGLAGTYGLVLMAVFMAKGKMSSVITAWLYFAGVLCVYALATDLGLGVLGAALFAPLGLFACIALMFLFIFGA